MTGLHIEELFKQVTSALASGVEAVAALIIALAATEATWRVLKVFLMRPAMPDEMKEDVRLRLARWLAVALEFELAADILRTAITPTWDEIGKLAAVAALRTILNYFLQKEIEANSRERSTLPGPSLADQVTPAPTRP
ncbi:DUF1622 domain-containing protein [Deinococcus lacus]|uniref:DUF1622 domain-containing protein n=1 Tax=Deinococcus lacus TaxID=392561 RepID=A0ABW1YB02_9DEIO